MPVFGQSARRSKFSVKKVYLAVWNHPFEIGMNIVLILLLGMVLSVSVQSSSARGALTALDDMALLEQEIAFSFSQQADYGAVSLASLESDGWIARTEAVQFEMSLSPLSTVRHDDSFRISMSGLGLAACRLVADQGRPDFGAYTRSFSINGGPAIVPTMVSGLQAEAACSPDKPNTITLTSQPGPLRDVPEPEHPMSRGEVALH
jgi:hypothetical protein